MPQRLGDLVQSFGYGASAGMTEPARAMLGAALAKDPSLYPILLESARQEREQRRKESPIGTSIAELGGSLATGGAVRTIPQNIAAGLVAGYNEQGQLSDAVTGAGMAGGVSGLVKAPGATLKELASRVEPKDPGPSLREMIAESAKKADMKEHSEKVLAQNLPRLQPYQAQQREALLSATALDINRIDLDKMPQDKRELLLAAQKHYMEKANMAQNMEMLPDSQRNALLRMIAYDKQLYQDTFAEAKKNYQREMPKPQMPQGPSMLQQMRTEMNKPMPMGEFLAQAIARYAAGSQTKEPPLR